MRWHTSKEKPDNGCECLISICENNAFIRLMFGEYWEDTDMFVECSDSASCWKREQVLAWTYERCIISGIRMFMIIQKQLCGLTGYDGILNNKEVWNEMGGM